MENQWTGFCMIGTSVMKDLNINRLIYKVLDAKQNLR